MARKTVKVEVNIKKPDDFSKLLNDIKKRDDGLGAGSILQKDPDIDMTVFANNLARADGLRKQSEDLRNQSESLMQQAKTIYGTATGQSINTPGTLYFQVDLIKKALLKKYKGNEEELSTYGFEVVVGQSKSPVKKAEEPGGGKSQQS